MTSHHKRYRGCVIAQAVISSLGVNELKNKNGLTKLASNDSPSLSFAGSISQRL